MDIAASVQLKTLDAAMRKLMKSMSLHLGGFISITPYIFGELWRYQYILNDITFSAFQVRKSYIGMTLEDAYIKSGIRKPTKGDT